MPSSSEINACYFPEVSTAIFDVKHFFAVVFRDCKMLLFKSWAVTCSFIKLYSQGSFLRVVVSLYFV